MAIYAYGYIGLRIYTPTDIYAYIHVYTRYLYILTDTYETGIYIFNNHICNGRNTTCSITTSYIGLHMRDA